MKVIPKDVAKTKFDIYICICQDQLKLSALAVHSN